MTDTTTLAPCPFCGGTDIAPSETHQAGHGESFTTYSVRCKNCGAGVSNSGYKGDAVNQYRAKVLCAWNRRAPAPASPALEKAVRKLHAAKGRHHNQIAACDLYDLLGLPNFRPGQEPPAQEARVPLTDSLAAEVVYSMGWELDDDEKDDMVRVVRATEGAHGITAAQKEAPCAPTPSP